MAGFTNITNRDQMKRYIKTKLGAPINNITVTNDQMDLIIDDCLLDLWRYYVEEATFLHYFRFDVVAGQSEYCFKGMGIQDAYNIEMSGLQGGITTLFSPMNIMYNNFINTTGNPMGSGFPFGASGPGAGSGNSFNAGNGGSLIMAEYQVGMTYLKQIENTFGKKWTVHWHPGREVLEVIPTPTFNGATMLALYVREEEKNLFNNPLVRKYMVAKCGESWGENLIMFRGSLPDGMEINSEGILARYTEMAEKALAQVRSESQPFDVFIG